MSSQCSSMEKSTSKSAYGSDTSDVVNTKQALKDMDQVYLPDEHNTAGSMDSSQDRAGSILSVSMGGDSSSPKAHPSSPDSQLPNLLAAALITALQDNALGNPALLLQQLLGFSPDDYNDLLAALSEPGASYVDIIASYLHNLRVVAEDHLSGSAACISESLNKVLISKYSELLQQVQRVKQANQKATTFGQYGASNIPGVTPATAQHLAQYHAVQQAMGAQMQQQQLLANLTYDQVAQLMAYQQQQQLVAMLQQSQMLQHGAASQPNMQQGQSSGLSMTVNAYGGMQPGAWGPVHNALGNYANSFSVGLPDVGNQGGYHGSHQMEQVLSQLYAQGLH